MSDDSRYQSRSLAAGLLDHTLERCGCQDVLEFWNTRPLEYPASVTLDGGLMLFEIDDHPLNFDVYSHPRSRYLVGASTRGLYICLSDPDDTLWAFHEEVSFVPAHARDSSDIVDLYDFAITERRTGTDLLAAAYRRDEKEAYCRVIGVIQDEVRQNAIQTISDHAHGRTPTFVDPMRHVTEAMKRDIAERSYPERQLLLNGRMPWHPEPWVAFLPGGGVAMVKPHVERHSTLGVLEQGVLQWDPPAGVVPRRAVFRPSDEYRDPGLLERFARARILAPAAHQEGVELANAHVPW